MICPVKKKWAWLMDVVKPMPEYLETNSVKHIWVEIKDENLPVYEYKCNTTCSGIFYYPLLYEFAF